MKVGVVGLGTMGAGIAQISVTAGHETIGREVSEELGRRGRATIERYLARAVEKGRMSAGERDAALARLSLTTELADLAECDLVIEAVLEELPLKREVFAPVLPLVEIVRAPRSSDAAVDTAYKWAEHAGKQPVRCNDTPGFIVNRILIPLLNDCVRALDETGVAPGDMDKAMTNGAGWPMGPCALIDLIGVDVHIHASEALHEKLHEEGMAPPKRLLQMCSEGRLGRKSGRGFFDY